MKTTWLLIKHQYKEWQQNKLIHIFIISVVCLWAFCLFTGISEYHAVGSVRESARQESRKQWLNQDDKHPHIAAHFGNFAFKPVNVLSIFDKGIDAYTGTYIYLEAHKQNDFLFSPAQSASSFIRFGELNVALLLQIIIPLFLIILTFNTVLSERISGTLAILKVSGITGRQVAQAKILAPLILISILIILLYSLSFLVFLSLEIPFTIEDIIKSVIIISGYVVYYFIILSFSVWVSAISKTLKQSLTILLSMWIFACVLMPKLLGNISSSLYHLPSNTAFKEGVKKDIVNGIDGHNTSDARAQRFTDSLLKKYQVDSTSQLPVNIEGLIMQEGEKYSSRVYNHHFDSLSNILMLQQKVFTYAGFINPLLSIKNLAIGLSGTDFFNDMYFRKEAEVYRMRFVQAMNEDMAINSKEGQFNTYKTGKRLYQDIDDFRYSNPDLSQILKNYSLEIVALFLLLAISNVLVMLTGRKI